MNPGELGRIIKVRVIRLIDPVARDIESAGAEVKNLRLVDRRLIYSLRTPQTNIEMVRGRLIEVASDKRIEELRCVFKTQDDVPKGRPPTGA